MNKTNITNSNNIHRNPKAKNAAYGSWKSPITASLLTKANNGLSEPQFDGKDIYWLESRPLEKGRNCIVKLDSEGNKQDILPAPLNARSRVNEYGGGSYCVNDGVIYFVLFDDQRIYSIDTQHADLGGKPPSPRALTPEDKNIRYGDLAFDPNRKRLLAVCEDHSSTTNKKNSKKEPDTYIVAIALDKNNGEKSPEIILSGEDFYSNPSVSPNGQKISWLSWNHPNMPWDETVCSIADTNQEGELSNITKVAGEKGESIFQPAWSPDNKLYFSSDKNNWWNICSYDPDSNDQDCIKVVYSDDAEYATPQWVFGLKTFDFLDSKTILTTYTKNGFWFLAKIHITENHEHNTKEDIKIESTDIGYISAHNGRGIFIGANSKSFESLFLYENNKKNNNTINPISVVSRSGSLSIDDGYLSQPESISFPITSTTSVTNAGHAFFYPPKNNDYQSQSDSNKSKLKPPLLVFCHGGPTAATHSSLNLKIQYWTSRGFAVADINYGGSTGYGRHYRDRLKNQWGIVDVQDAIDCVIYLSDENKIDSEKTAIRGGSAGGYTVLSALTFHNVFKAGTSLYGIGDLETLATDTHKFESRYLDQLVGPYPADKQTYQDRSPINFVEQLNCPVLFLQGLKDKVVPPNQAEAMVDALDKQKIAVAYVTFADEGHGFRQAKNIQHALEAELYFYSKVFNFQLVEDIKPINIKHIDNVHR